MSNYRIEVYDTTIDLGKKACEVGYGKSSEYVWVEDENWWTKQTNRSMNKQIEEIS